MRGICNAVGAVIIRDDIGREWSSGTAKREK